MTTKEKRGIWFLLVRDSRPTTAKQVNEQSYTHANGIYGKPLKVCMTAWLAVGTPTGRYIPTRSTNLCNVLDLLFECGSFESPKTKRQRRISIM